MESRRWEELVPTQDLEADSESENASEPSTPGSESLQDGRDLRAMSTSGRKTEAKKCTSAWRPAVVVILVLIGALGAFVAYRATTTRTTATVQKKMERQIEHHHVPAPTPAPTIGMKVLLWNVYWQNRDVKAIAEVLAANDADIIGIDEFIPYGAGKYTDLVHEINLRTTTRSFELQPNVKHWFMGYGTDILFDSNVWEVLEGGKQRVFCPGTRDGGRAANWVVLQHRTSQEKLITGGIHLSYCPESSCDWTHECEMGKLYDKLEEMKAKHDGLVLWMGDLNHCIWDRVIDNALDGHIGKRSVFTMEDLVKAKEEEKPTIMDGGCAIDHIIAESAFERLDGGRTGQQNNGQKIGGSDHYPVFASVRFPRRSTPGESQAHETT